MAKKKNAKKPKIHSINNSDKNYGITTKIDTDSYIMLHKSEVESIVVNANTMTWKTEFFEKSGTFLLGGAISAYFTDISFLMPTIFLVLGAGLTWLSISEKKEKNKLITKLLDDKLHNAQKG